jgi:hypothetical protein
VPKDAAHPLSYVTSCIPGTCSTGLPQFSFPIKCRKCDSTHCSFEFSVTSFRSFLTLFYLSVDILLIYLCYFPSIALFFHFRSNSSVFVPLFLCFLFHFLSFSLSLIVSFLIVSFLQFLYFLCSFQLAVVCYSSLMVHTLRMLLLPL